MSLLEDRILRIVEMERAKHDEAEIAQALGISPASVEAYRSAVKQTLNRLNGSAPLEEIAEFSGLSQTALSIVAGHYGINLNNSESNSQNANAVLNTPVSDLHLSTRPRKALMRLGIKTIGELSEKGPNELLSCRNFGVTSLTEVIRALEEHNLILKDGVVEVVDKKLKLKRTEREEQIRACIKSGITNVQDISQKIGLSPVYVYQLAVQCGIKVPFSNVVYSRARRRPDIDALIGSGNYREIGENVGLSRERVRQYITGTGQYVAHHDKLKARKEEKKLAQKAIDTKEGGRALRQITSQLLRRIYDRAETFEERKAAEYKIACLGASNHFSSLINLFRERREAEERGEDLSLEDFQRKTGIHFTKVGIIFRAVGLNSMKRKPAERRSNLSAEEKARIGLASVLTLLSNGDIAHFTPGVGGYIVCRIRQDIGLKGKLGYIRRFGYGENFTLLNYRLASQVYEARDLGFKINEIAELFDANEGAVKYALQNRRPIAKEIKYALNLLHPEKTHRKPYLDN